MVSSENRRIRARQLKTRYPESAHLLDLYIELTLLQDDVAKNPAADLAGFIPRLRALVPQIECPDDVLDREPVSEREQFFRRVLIQPGAERSRKIADGRGSTCPACGSKPVVGVLRGEGDGAKRGLLCSLCRWEWDFRRVICPNCGEEDKDKLPIYIAEQVGYVRLEACETCRTYLKSVDLTKDGFAVAEVDEIATVALNLWADQNGYTKIETNILGM
jgi:FdhE protein